MGLGPDAPRHHLKHRAEVICEAVTRPTMRFVAVKTREQQGFLMLHKSGDLLVRQRTASSMRCGRISPNTAS
jgi:transposase